MGKQQQRFVVHFQQGHAGMKQLLGGKGANLAEMSRAGLPVPPGYTITTDACRDYFSATKLPDGLMEEALAAMKELEKQKGQSFGDAEHPLLVSVRSGSVTSMPGMMDTILNLGLNDETVKGLAKASQNERFAYDCYRRLIQMFGNVVFGVSSEHYDRLLQRWKNSKGIEHDQQIDAAGWQVLIEQFKQCTEQNAQTSFPQNVHTQLELAIEAVFRSWNNSRAKLYRSLHQIPDDQGTAVNVQSMVFGNLGEDCGTGVLFTRDPSSGEKRLFGEYLTNAQGEDVVAGTRTPVPINQLEREMPQLYQQLRVFAHQLEHHYRDMQDIEFTIEKGKLYLLQTRNGKRTAQAALKICVELVNEGIISKEEALQRMDSSHLEKLLHPTFDPNAELSEIAVGLPASPGAATGQAAFDADTAEAWARSGKDVILVRTETSPEDIQGMLLANGVLTCRGGITSHAAVVARGMGKPCVSGCESLRLNADERYFSIGDHTVREGDWISIDGASGRVMLGKVPLQAANMTTELTTVLQWADEVRIMKVYANADNPDDAAKARELGAEGIGLCRTEHMFMSPDRLALMQDMILAETSSERQQALARLLPLQQQDFVGIFQAMDGLSVTIRLLDPPLHEFLPQLEQLVERRTRMLCMKQTDSEEFTALEQLIRKVRSLHEANPMLGQRGCRLGIVFPEIYEMQVEAILNAVKECAQKGVRAKPEMMIPLVSDAHELQKLRAMIKQKAKHILGTEHENADYRVGTMIEIPRAALTADRIAEHADFFAFGTNDLTQMTFGCSRDDAEGKFLTHYLEQKILANNPFQVIDQEGVGQLIEMASEKARQVKPALKMGVCGEHGGDHQSIFYCQRIGLQYVSCSPYRIPSARISAAQAKLRMKEISYPL